MLENRSLIYFAPERWDGMWRNRQQLMSVFARHGNRVLFVEPRPDLRNLLSGVGDDPVHHPRWSDPSLREVAPNLHVFRYPMWAPVSGRAPIKQIAAAVRKQAIRRAMRRVGVVRPIVWISRPYMQDVLAELPDRSMLIYHVVDEYSAYYGTAGRAYDRIVEGERRLLHEADMVVVVSENLLASKQPFNPRTYLVANGVDYELYARALQEPALPEALAAVRAPRLGYIGHIGERLDFDALGRIATGHPEWSFVFVGEVRFAAGADRWSAFTQLPNVHYLGTVPASEVASYVKGFQVGLMPYVRDRHSDNVSPLKLYEYFAAGIPIVSSDIPAVREFDAVVHLVGSEGDYEAAVEAALADQSHGRREARLDLARQASWKARAERIAELIERYVEDGEAAAVRGGAAARRKGWASQDV